MQSTEAPAAPSTIATEANHTLERHHYQALACLINAHRPEWAPSETAKHLLLSRDGRTFPELAALALTVAMDPKYAVPSSIYFAAMGLFGNDGLQGL